jgi:membrane protease YdiL (CAAX protease family)
MPEKPEQRGGIFTEKRGKVLPVIIIMALASLSVIIPLTVFSNVYAVFFLYYIGMCLLIPLADLMFVRKLSFIDTLNFIGFNNENRKGSMYAGLTHGLLASSLMIAGFFVFREAFTSDDIVKSLAQWGVMGSTKWIIFFLMVLFNGIVEEIFWRGYTFGGLKGVLKKWSAILIVTFFYTSYHLATVLTFFKVSFIGIQIVVFIFIAGLLWGWMRYRFNNILASTIGHTLLTIGYMIIFLLI